MLWRVMRIDPCFPWIYRLFVAALLIRLLPQFGPAFLAALFSATIGVAAANGGFQRRAYHYQTVLALPARTVWLSGLLVQTLMFLVPCSLLLPTFGLRLVAVILSFVFARALLCAWNPDRESAPGALVALSSLALAAVLTLLEITMRPVWFFVVGAVTIALYFWAWTQIPASFQLASRTPENGPDNVPAATETVPVAPTKPPNWLARNRPFLRVFAGWRALLFLVVVPVQTVNVRRGETLIAIVFVPILFQTLWSLLSWMDTTPTSRRRLFAWVMGIPLALYSIAFASFGLMPGATVGGQPLDARYLTMGFGISLAMLGVIFHLSTARMRLFWRMQPRIPAIAAIGAMIAIFCGLVMPLTTIDGKGQSVSVLSKAGFFLSRYLTDQPLQLSLLAVLMLYACYRIMERTFEHCELTPSSKSVEGL